VMSPDGLDDDDDSLDEDLAALGSASIVGVRLECRLDTSNDWTPGVVTAEATSEYPGWAEVQFDDGRELQVHLDVANERQSWRWLDSSTSSDGSDDGSDGSDGSDDEDLFTPPKRKRICADGRDDGPAKFNVDKKRRLLMAKGVRDAALESAIQDYISNYKSNESRAAAAAELHKRLLALRHDRDARCVTIDDLPTRSGLGGSTVRFFAIVGKNLTKGDYERSIRGLCTERSDSVVVHFGAAGAFRATLTNNSCVSAYSLLKFCQTEADSVSFVVRVCEYLVTLKNQRLSTLTWLKELATRRNAALTFDVYVYEWTVSGAAGWPNRRPELVGLECCSSARVPILDAVVAAPRNHGEADTFFTYMIRVRSGGKPVLIAGVESGELPDHATVVDMAKQCAKRRKQSLQRLLVTVAHDIGLRITEDTGTMQCAVLKKWSRPGSRPGRQGRERDAQVYKWLSSNSIA
jgi:hypothetical protein